jgi:lysozyme
MASRALELAAELARQFEGCHLAPYHDPVGFATVGYGHLLSRQPWAPLAQWPAISQEEANTLLLQDMAEAERVVARLCPVPLTDGQRAALADFAFNVGGGNLQASSLRQAVLREDHERAAEQFGRWVYARGVKLRGLVRRRDAEARLYLQG